MGARGPRRRAAGAVADDRNGQQEVLIPIEQARAELVVPDPPRGLLTTVRDEWYEFWDSNVALLLEPSDHAVVRRLFKLKDEQERCYRETRRTKTTTMPGRYDREGNELVAPEQIEHSGRLAVGSTGQMVLSPEAKYTLALATEIRQLEDRLAQNLRARSGLQQIVVPATAGAAPPAAPQGAVPDVDSALDQL